MNVRNYCRPRKKAPADLFSLKARPAQKPITPRVPRRVRDWQRYLQSLRDKDLHRQRIDAENAKVPF